MHAPGLVACPGRRRGSDFTGDADAVWATLRAVHEAMLAAGAAAGPSHIKVASIERTMESLVAKFRV